MDVPDARRLRSLESENPNLKKLVAEQLTGSVQRGLGSGAYTQGILSDNEVVLAGFHDWIRERLPVAHFVAPPQRRTMAERNASLAA